MWLPQLTPGGGGGDGGGLGGGGDGFGGGGLGGGGDGFGGGGDGDGGDGGGCGDGGDSGGDGGAGAAQLGYSVAKRSFCAENDAYVSCRRLASASRSRAVKVSIPLKPEDVTEVTSQSSCWLKALAL